MPGPGPRASASDETLMLAYAAGDAAAFDQIHARHKGGVYRYLLRHCGRAASADELFQDVWMSVVRARATYAPTAKFTTWLYRIARNRLVDHWRTSSPLTRASERAGDEGDPPDPLDAHAGCATKATPRRRRGNWRRFAPRTPITRRCYRPISSIGNPPRDSASVGLRAAARRQGRLLAQQPADRGG